MYLIAFPLLLIPFVLYNMVAFLLDLEFTTTLFSVPLLSGRSMAVSTGDLLVLLGSRAALSRDPQGDAAVQPRRSWITCCRSSCSS